ncbi:MAG: outer membrane lipoprotein-sorting protein [Gammaproteobacteria bacterium]|nr:outer membrane lipoprotein-sorting protein [Gammaproteobacteria bacterium]
MTLRLTARLLLLFTTLTMAASGQAGDLSAEQIMQQSNTLYRGDDSISTIAFTFSDGHRGGDRKMAFTMLWKQYKKGSDFKEKVLFFQEIPAAFKGAAYLGWLANSASQQKNQEWIYMLETRTIRKLNRNAGHHHHHGGGDGNSEDDNKDAFSKSLLHRPNLTIRSASLDQHTLLRKETNNGQSFYVIESTPKNDTKEYPYAKVIHWISVDNLLNTRADYYNPENELQLRVTRQWKKIKDAWVWTKVTGESIAHPGHKTVIELSDIRINSGLTDRDFSKRMLRNGASRYKH